LLKFISGFEASIYLLIPVFSRLIIYSSPPRPDRLWCPPSLPPNGYQGLFPWE